MFTAVKRCSEHSGFIRMSTCCARLVTQTGPTHRCGSRELDVQCRKTAAVCRGAAWRCDIASLSAVSPLPLLRLCSSMQLVRLPASALRRPSGAAAKSIPLPLLLSMRQSASHTQLASSHNGQFVMAAHPQCAAAAQSAALNQAAVEHALKAPGQSS